jgi:hypothetical protein
MYLRYHVKISSEPLIVSSGERWSGSCFQFLSRSRSGSGFWSFQRKEAIGILKKYTWRSVKKPFFGHFLSNTRSYHTHLLGEFGLWFTTTEFSSVKMSEPDQAAFNVYPVPAMVSVLCLTKSGSAIYSCCKLQKRIKIQNIKLKYHSPHTDWGRSNKKTKH